MMMKIRQVRISSFLHASLLDLTTRWTRRTRFRTRTRWTRQLEGLLSFLIETLVFALLIANEEMIPWLNQGVCLYSPEEAPRHGSGLFSSPSDQTAFESRAKMRFSRSVGEPSGTYPKRSDNGGRGRPAGPLSGRSVHDGPHLGSSLTGACVVVPCPKSINSHQTEFRWGSYARFTEPRSATDIFWLWTPNMANDISVSIISTSSSQCYTLILRFEILLDCSFVGVGSEYDWDTSWSRYSAVFLFSPYKSQLHQNSWKYVSVNPNKVI
jgi:hypothetical protein